VSESTFLLANGRYSFEQRGKVSAKYKGEIEMYFLK